jgi:two-component system chemotaxis response regulator CheB
MMTLDLRRTDQCIRRLYQRRLKVVVLGASAGGVEALLDVIPSLAPQMPFAVAAVLHLPADGRSVLPQLLAEQARVPVKEAETCEPLQAGTVYLAPPDYHLSIEPDLTFSLSTEEPIHFSRPSIDVLFESAAVAVGRDLLAILLTGANADGALGLSRVREAGGLTVVQDSASAKAPEMPQAALRRMEPDCLLTLDELKTVFAALSEDVERKTT